MKIITWNINSLKARWQRLLSVLDRHQPDVLCLQETKCLDAAFPAQQLAAAGYHALYYGQKSYNGVAVLTKSPAEELHRGNPLFAEDDQARLLTAEYEGVTIINAYCPNGSAVGSDKFAYKLTWFAKLAEFLEQHCDPDEPLVLCGDFNIAPRPEDVWNPERFAGKLLYSEPEHAALKRLLDFGLADMFGAMNPGKGHYSWWDYRNFGFQRDEGWRIDYHLISEPLLDSCAAYHIDTAERQDDRDEKPSDHAPVILELSL